MVTCDCRTVSYQNCLIVSIAFFLVFSGFNGAQRFATSASESADERDISFAIIYSIIPFATLFVGPIIRRISAHKVFFIATSCYVLYIGANIKVIPILLYITSCFVGIAAPCLWISRNVFITKCSNHNELFHHQPLNSKLGLFNGTFWMIFQFSACLGSIIGGLLFQFNGSIIYLYALFTIVCIIGVLTFCLIRPMHFDQDVIDNDKTAKLEMQLMLNTSTNSNDKEVIESDEPDINNEVNIVIQHKTIKSELLQSGKKMIQVFKKSNFWVLAPFTMYSGLEMAFDSADFPTLITNNTTKFYILGYYGLISVVSSFIIGKISDYINRLYIILLLSILHGIAWFSLYFYHDVIYDAQNIMIFILFATLFGIGFAIIATQKLAIIPILISNDAEVWQCIGLIESPSAAFIFYIHSYLTFETKVIINCTILFISIIPFICIKSVRNVLKPEDKIKQKIDDSLNL